MEWANLKIACCPSCGSPLQAEGLLGGSMMCRQPQCTFKISEEKMNEIVKDKVGKGKLRGRPFAPQHDNMAELNNLGHELVSEDFSDNAPEL